MNPGASGARLAQSAERKALNLVVVGSSPTVGVFLSLYHILPPPSPSFFLPILECNAVSARHAKIDGKKKEGGRGEGAASPKNQKNTKFEQDLGKQEIEQHSHS